VKGGCQRASRMQRAAERATTTVAPPLPDPATLKPSCAAIVPIRAPVAQWSTGPSGGPKSVGLSSRRSPVRIWSGAYFTVPGGAGNDRCKAKLSVSGRRWVPSESGPFRCVPDGLRLILRPSRTTNHGSRHTTNPPVPCLGRSFSTADVRKRRAFKTAPPNAPSGGPFWHGFAVRRPLLGGGGGALTFGFVQGGSKDLGTDPIQKPLSLDRVCMRSKAARTRGDSDSNWLTGRALLASGTTTVRLLGSYASSQAD
jgi:hypothetical protein